MIEAEWLTCTDPTAILEFLRGKASDRKLRLLAVASGRRCTWHLKTKGNRRAIEVGEAFADGRATAEELASVLAEAESWVGDVAVPIALGAAMGVVTDACEEQGRRAGEAAWDFGESRNAYWVAERKAQAALLRCVFPYPFRPSSSLAQAVLAWNDGTVRRIAEGIYEERRMPDGTFDASRLAILADALLDAGCDHDDLIQHCRSDGPHVRGCWAVDLILGKS
jgi:hypothetical protein